MSLQRQKPRSFFPFEVWHLRKSDPKSFWRLSVIKKTSFASVAPPKVLIGKGDSGRARQAADEAGHIKKAAQKLKYLIARAADDKKVDWGDAIRNQRIVANLQRGVLGANLSADEWQAEMTHLLSCFRRCG